MEPKHSNIKSIDWDLSIKLANDKPELAKELLEILITELPKTKELINQAYEGENYSLLHQQIHKLHGATCYCGVPRLKEITASFETKLKKNEKQSMKKLIALLNKEIEQLLTEYKQDDYQNA